LDVVSVALVSGSTSVLYITFHCHCHYPFCKGAVTEMRYNQLKRTSKAKL